MVKLVIDLRDGGFEVNEFNIEKKVSAYLNHLHVALEKKNNSIGNDKSVNIAIGSMLTYRAILAGLEVEKNGFKKLISEVNTFVTTDEKNAANMDVLENINLYISMIKNHGRCELLDFSI